MEGLSTEAQALHNNFKAIDPSQGGVGLDKIRPFYPRVGWNKILGWVGELESQNLIGKTPKFTGKGAIAFYVYTWKDAS